MSRFFTSRRKYSEPDTPAPRSQWRMRVESLMKDDGQNDADLEKATCSSRSRNSTQNSQNVESSVSHSDVLQHDNKEKGKTALSSLSKRQRFARTKSEGSLKLRVKFSRSLDHVDIGNSSDESPKVERKIGLLSRSRTERGRAGESSSDRLSRRGNKGEGGVVGGISNYRPICGSPSGNYKETGTGAIPKYIRDEQYAHRSDDSISSDDGRLSRNRRKSHKSSSPDSAIGESIPKSHVSLRDRSSSSDEENETYKTQRSFEARDHFLNSPSCNYSVNFHGDDRGSFDDMVTSSSTGGRPVHREKDIHDGRQSPKTERLSAEGDADDIESIIEQLIAEEEREVSMGNTTRVRSQMSDFASHGLAVNKEEEGSCEENAHEECARMLASQGNHLLNMLVGQDIHLYHEDTRKLQEAMDDCNREAEVATFGLKADDSEGENVSLASHNRPCDHEQTDDCIAVRGLYLPSQSVTTSHINYDEEETVDYGEWEDSQSTDDEDSLFNSWANLPMVLMEDVLTMLTPKERHLASQVCRQWYDLFYSPRVWETFILLERTLTKKRFNLYKGYQRELCPGKTQLCFRRVGSFFKRIVVTPITDYFNLYEFLRILAAFLQFREDQQEFAMPLLHTFDFTFACATRGDGGVIIHGTGGQILEMIKELLIRMSGSLKHLKLNQLLLETSEVAGFIRTLVECFSDCLHSLEILNFTKIPFSISEVASFRNLIKLVISPQHLDDETVLMLAGLGLTQLHILQDPYTCPCEPVPSEVWKLAREMAPWMRVYLEIAGNTKTPLLIQPRAPVHGIFMRSPHGVLSQPLIMTIVENYSNTLRYLVQEHLPRTHGLRGFERRCDSSLLYLVRRCPRLHTLVLRERISTATLILLATEGKSWKTLLVRQNALIKRCDWPQRGEFPADFYKQLKEASLDYRKCFDKICTILRTRWKPLTDKQFMRIKIIPRLEMY